jgi:hypothetical protein
LSAIVSKLSGLVFMQLDAGGGKVAPLSRPGAAWCPFNGTPTALALC